MQTVSLDGVWMIRFDALEDEDTMIMHVEEETGGRLTRASATMFNEADVRKPLASAGLVAGAGNRIVMVENGGTSRTRRRERG